MLQIFVAWLTLLVAHPALGALPDLSVPHVSGASFPADAAVVVGVEDYLREVPDVPYARVDARLFYDLLVYTRGVPSDQIQILTKTVSRDSILAALDRSLGEVGEGGVLWFYFAGHGAADPGSRQRLLLGDDVEPLPASFLDRGVLLSEIKDAARARGVRLVMVIDACYTGFGRSGEAIVSERTVPLSTLRADSDVIQWTAASFGETSGPLEAAGHGAFTWFAVGALRGWADGADGSRRDGVVTASEAHLWVKGALRKAERNSQTPMLVTTGMDESLALVEGSLEAAPPLAHRDFVARRVVGDTPPLGSGVIETGIQLDYGADVVNEPTELKAYLFVQTEPVGAQIIVNGKKMGASPWQGLVMVGEYVVTATAPSHHPAQQRVHLEGEAARVTLDLPVAFGTLVIESAVDGAEAWLDGERLGPTPRTLREKPSGSYELRVSADLHHDHIETVVVSDGEATRVRARPEPNYGSLLVASTPRGASIELNGAPTAKATPWTFDRVQAGLAIVRLDLPGHGHVVEEATVHALETAKVEATLQAEIGVLYVTSLDKGVPCEGRLLVDGDSVGRTPGRFELSATRHHVEARCGDKRDDAYVDIIHNRDTELRLSVATPLTEKGRQQLLVKADRIEASSDGAKLTRNVLLGLGALTGVAIAVNAGDADEDYFVIAGSIAGGFVVGAGVAEIWRQHMRGKARRLRRQAEER